MPFSSGQLPLPAFVASAARQSLRSRCRKRLRLLKHPTHILAATLRAFYETVTSSCVIGPWMLWGVFLFLVASIEPSQSVGMPTRPSPTQILDDNPAKRHPCKAPIAWENLTDGCQFVDGVAPTWLKDCLLYTSPSPRDATLSRMPSSA